MIITLGVSICFIGFGVRADWLVLRLFRFVVCLLGFGLVWCFYYWFGLGCDVGASGFGLFVGSVVCFVLFGLLVVCFD